MRVARDLTHNRQGRPTTHQPFSARRDALSRASFGVHAKGRKRGAAGLNAHAQPRPLPSRRRCERRSAQPRARIVHASRAPGADRLRLHEEIRP